MKDLVTEFLRQGLGLTPPRGSKTPAASSMVVIDANGLPVIRCAPRAPATRMTVAELLKLEQETQLKEDMQRAGITL